MKKQLLINAALAGIIAAGTVSVGAEAFAKDKKGEMGLCSHANSCAGKGACGESKGKTSGPGTGNAMMTKAECDKLAKSDAKAEHKWMSAPKENM